MDSFSTSLSDLYITNKRTYDTSNLLIFIIVIIIIVIIIIIWTNLNLFKEGMSNGTLTQLFANDSQDVYLKSNIDKLATGNFDLFWNQPTRVANTFMNRGSPLPTFILPDTPMNPNPYPIVASNNYTDYIINQTSDKPNKIIKSKKNKKNKNSINYNNYNNSNNSPGTYPNNVLPSSLPMPLNPNNPPNPYELTKVAEQISKTKEQSDNLPAMTTWKEKDYLYQKLYDNLLYDKNCLKDPSSCGGGAGGFRLGEDFVQATKAKPFVEISGDTFFPDSYVGSYFTEPTFDIVKPYPYMPNSTIS